MNGPLVWIFFPALVGVALFFIRGRRRTASLTAGAICLLLAGLALLLPSSGSLAIGPLTLNVGPSLAILGRQLLLTPAEYPLLAMLYAFGAFWILGSMAVPVTPLFAPAGLVILAVFVAALAVEPFLYAALLVEMAVLLSVPLLAASGQQNRPGLLRYLIFMTLGMPFILLAGRIFGSVEISPSRQQLLEQTAVLLALGFSFWLAVFPFYSWVPLLVEESNPFIAGFLLSLLSTVILLLGADFLNGFTWLRDSPYLPRGLLAAGLIMVATAGVWAALQRNLARLMAYAFIAENGYALLSLAAGNPGLNFFASAFMPRILTIALWSLALAVLLVNGEELQLEKLHGLMRRAPLPALALVLACFSTGGLPLLASFPVRFGLFSTLTMSILPALAWGLVSSAGFLFAGFHMLSTFLIEAPGDGTKPINRPQRWMLAVGLVMLLAAGWLPGPVLQGMIGLLTAFPNLVR